MIKTNQNQSEHNKKNGGYNNYYEALNTPTF